MRFLYIRNSLNPTLNQSRTTWASAIISYQCFNTDDRNSCEDYRTNQNAPSFADRRPCVFGLKLRSLRSSIAVVDSPSVVIQDYEDCNAFDCQVIVPMFAYSPFGLVVLILTCSAMKWVTKDGGNPKSWMIDKDKQEAALRFLREQSAKAGRPDNHEISGALSKSHGPIGGAADSRADSFPGPSVMQLPEQVLAVDSTPPWRRPLPPPPPPPSPATCVFFQDASLIDSTTYRPPSRRVTIDSWCESRGCGQKRESLQCLFCAVHCAWPAGCSWPNNISGLCTVHWDKPYRCQHADNWCHHSSKQKDKASCKHLF
jgi:hypothetical protein